MQRPRTFRIASKYTGRELPVHYEVRHLPSPPLGQCHYVKHPCTDFGRNPFEKGFLPSHFPKTFKNFWKGVSGV